MDYEHNKFMNKDNQDSQPPAGGRLAATSSPISRDLAIDAAIHALMRIKCPTISNAQIQRRGEMNIYSGGYIVKLDGEPICAVELDGTRRFVVNILALSL